MLLKLIRFFRGYVDFSVSGKFPERFMNITALYGINLWNAVPIQNGIGGSMYLCDYRKIRLIARKSRVRARVQKRHGLPFFINRYKQRSGLAAGAIVSIILLVILSNFIWSIKIVGTNRISDTYLYNVLAENGVSVGAYKNDIDVESIERSVSLKVKQIGWMSINITGNVINVEVKEKAEKPPVDTAEKPCNIKAKRDGVITKVKAESGKIEVLRGSGVTKGDLLVSGLNQTKNDSVYYVRARAEVFADVTEKRELSIPKRSNYYSLTENSTQRNRLKFMWLQFPCSLSFESYDDFVSSQRSQNLLVNDVVLPLGISTLTTNELSCESVVVSRAMAEKIIDNDILLFEVFEKPQSTAVKREIALVEKSDGYNAEINYIFNENIAESVEFEVTE